MANMDDIAEGMKKLFGRPCCVWVVEFPETLTSQKARKIYLTATDMSAAEVAQMVASQHPATEFIAYSVDAGVFTLPEQMQHGDICYSPDSRHINQDGKVSVDVINDEEGFDDSELQIITFKSPGA